MKIVCISDTHSQHNKIDVPAGDVLIHSGDATMTGRPHEWERFLAWWDAQPHKTKIFVPGNHDFGAHLSLPHGMNVMVHASFSLLDVPCFGSAFTPKFGEWAYMAPRGRAMANLWEQIPDDTEILITHGPPKYIRDQTFSGEHVGCFDLATRIKQLPKLRAHIFGHIHEGYGVSQVSLHPNVDQPITFVNAAICDWRYRPLNAPIVIDA